MDTAKKLRSFAEDRSGNVAILAGIGITAIAATAALVVNYGLITSEKQRLQNGLDAAALAAAYVIPTGLPAATEAGIAAYTKQIPAGASADALTSSAFIYGVWNDDTKTFTPGPSTLPLYYIKMQPAYYNAVRVAVGEAQATKFSIDLVMGATLPAANGDGAPQTRAHFNATSIAYTPPSSCVYIRNIGNPHRYGVFPDGTTYKKWYPDTWAFVLTSSHNSSWNTCGYINSTDTGYTAFGSPTVGTYALSTTGNFAASWVRLGEGVSHKLREPVTIPDEAVAPYRNSSCQYNNTVIDTAADVTLTPGTYCGGLYIKKAGAKVTLNPGVYLIRDGVFKLDKALTKPSSATIDPISGMPVGPNPSGLNTIVEGVGVTILLQGSGSYIHAFGGGLYLTAPTLSQSPTLGGMAIHSFDSNPDPGMNYFQSAYVKIIGTMNTPEKKYFAISTQWYVDCDTVCANIGNLALQNTKIVVYPGQFLQDPKTMALSPKARRPTYPMIRMSSDQPI